MKIQLLDTNTINKIAAGEVIERPASVVKELVENSIDAGAKSITVEVKDGGTTFIRVTDDGIGIEREDLVNAFKKHATSKIHSLEDLDKVSSLGFRGEALSSIAAIAKVELLTKTTDSPHGYRYVIEGGEEIEISEVGLSEGTSFIVKDLFFNTPVRKKFLKSPSAEGANVSQLMERFALSNPNISFKYILGDKLKLSTTGNGNLKDVVYKLFGRDITNNLLEINASSEDVEITGYIGKPIISRGNRSFENYAVNGRYIKNDSLSDAIEDAYRGFIMLHNYPFTALLFKINPELLDVNVHPAKREFRMTASEKVCIFVRDAIREAILKSDLIPDVKPDMVTSADIKTEKDYKTESPSNSIFTLEDFRLEDSLDNISVEEEVKEDRAQYSTEYQNFAQSLLSNAMESVDESHDMAPEFKPPIKNERDEFFEDIQDKKNFLQEELVGINKEYRFRLLGQLFATYWLIEDKDTFYMMDQHAAHEKVLYERLMKSTKGKNPETQILMVPELIDIAPDTFALLEDNHSIFSCFAQLGYDVGFYEGNAIKVTGIPGAIPSMDYRRMVVDVLDMLVSKTEIGLDLSDAPQLMLEKIASMSCKAAIKGHDKISEREALELIEELMEADNPYNCPHGRPTLIAMTKYEIEKKFGRIV